jgi:hypothetical protein
MVPEALAQLTTILDETHQPINPLRHHQVREYRDEVRRIGGIIEQRDMDGTPGQNWIGGDTSKASRRVRQIKDILTNQAPRKLTGERANRAHALATEIIKDAITPAMLTRAIMRRNPAGAVGEYRRREGTAAFKRAALTVKRAIRALDPENDDPDLTNLERFRPEGSATDGTSTFMADATIPGFLAMSPKAKENWPLGEPTADTALKQVVRAATNGTKTKPIRAKRPASPAQLAHMARLHAAQAAKRGEAPKEQVEP